MNITNETKILVGIIVVTVFIIIGGAFLAGRNNGGSGEPLPADQLERLVRADDPVLGSAEAQVTVVEFGDFQCPACGALHPVLKQIKETNKEAGVRFIYRHFPLEQHEFAQKAAEAAVEAQEQGKFWEYHDVLFENQLALDRPDLERYAEQLGFGMDEFRRALDENTHTEAVLQDRSDGNAVGVRGTPSVYINGVLYTGAYSVEGLQAAIDQVVEIP